MRSSIFILPAIIAAATAIGPWTPSQVPPGALCESGFECQGSSWCTSWMGGSSICGNTGSICHSDSNCAFNTCEEHFCLGDLPSKREESSKPFLSVLLGGACEDDFDCYGSAMCGSWNDGPALCGNTGVSCLWDMSCAFNNCEGGRCIGGLPLKRAVNASTTPSSTSSGPKTTGSAAPGTVALGDVCSPTDDSPCIFGADCYAVNSGLMPTCGNFKASCSNNAQCAFNTCVDSLCSGMPTNGSVPVGSACSPKIPGQCANGADCYSTNSMLTPTCGNFQASCTSDSQCAFNTCKDGLCNGFRSLTNASTTHSRHLVPTYVPCLCQPQVCIFDITIPHQSVTSATLPCKPAQSTMCSCDASVAQHTGYPTTSYSSATATADTGKPGYSNATATANSGTSYGTSIIVVAGKTTSVLVDQGGATAAFGATVNPSGVLESETNDASKTLQGLGALVVVAMGFSFLF